MNLLIKDNFFSNPDVLRRFALDCDYIDSEEVKVDVGWSCLLYTSDAADD